MSLGKITTKVKSGIADVQSASGIKKVVVHLGLGFVVGVIADLVLEAIWRFSGVGEYLSKAGYPALVGFSLFPQNTEYMAWNATTQAYELKQGAWMSWDDTILLVSTIVLLMSKKFWIVIGYFLGWYASSYMNLYTSLGLPLQLPDLTQPLT